MKKKNRTLHSNNKDANAARTLLLKQHNLCHLTQIPSRSFQTFAGQLQRFDFKFHPIVVNMFNHNPHILKVQ